MSQSFLKTTIAGGAGGACLVLVGHPLDTIKVRIQTMTVAAGQAPPYSGTLDCALKTMRAEGPFALYKGITSPLLGVIPMYALCFFGYEIGKRVFTTEESYRNLQLLDIAAAGATSGLFTTPILAPLERIKCVLQVQGPERKYKGTIDCAKQLYRSGGLSSVNRGFCATMLRDSVASAFYFSSYAWLKHHLTPEGQAAPGVAGTLFAGGTAGILNWLFAIPIDTMKSRLQVAPEGKYPNGIRSVFFDILRNEKPSSFFRGVGPILIRAFPANAACFLGYETAIKVLDMFGMK
jgi:solute carrier family 25 (mitochondrial carnitine/acylcarnitine transporter), member 20/29